MERRTTGIILVNELHYLALEERLRLREREDPKILDTLPIIRLTGQATKSSEPIEVPDTEPWETIKRWEGERLEYDYFFLNPEHAAFGLQKASKRYLDRGFRTVPINYLELQIDPYPEDRNVFRIGFNGKRLLTGTETWKTAYSRINSYRDNYGLYRPINAGDEEQIRMWLGRLHCLELYSISRGSRMAKDGVWRHPRDVTKNYLERDFRETGDFFPILWTITGGLVEEVYQIYDRTERGWIFDGLVRERPEISL